MTIFRRLLPIFLLVLLLAVAALILLNPPKQPADAGDRRLQMAVETMTVVSQPYQVFIESYGRIEPVTRSLLVAQVSGQITKVAESFSNGGSFGVGDVILRIDDGDYRANLKVAEAALLDASRVLVEEQARGELALADWRRSGKSGQPSALVLREPQLLAARAGVLSAEASLERAKLDLQRTVVRAPYSGYVLARNVDLGQVVSVNERLGEIYAANALEVRLPLRNRDLAYIALPRGDRTHDLAGGSRGFDSASVWLYSNLAAEQVWRARLVRSEAAIDAASRQLHVVAEYPGNSDHSDAIAVTDNVSINNVASDNVATNKAASGIAVTESGSEPPLPPRVGQYVTARLQGKLLNDAIVIPLQSIYQGSFVYVVEDGHVFRRQISIAWQNQSDALIGKGLERGEQVVLTPMGQVVSGTPVKVVQDTAPREDAGSKELLAP
ncbi:MAG: HlyD family efflux transporter periplasmic adaptor subunit [Pseudomonadales bacterium]